METLIPIYKPYLHKYKTSATDAINSEWISNYGKYIELTTEKLKKFFNIKYCILTNNGTSATHCIIKSIKYKYPNINKIYVPNNVFISPLNCVLLEYEKNQIEIMKINYETYNIDTNEDYIKSLEPNSAIVIVHNLGNIINVPRLKRIRPDIIFVEDNCEGIFGKYENIYSGTFSDTLCSSVSFYGNKTITTGEGGAFLTNDEDIYNYIKHYYSHGMTNIRYIHDMVASNYRMTNIQAALLYDQMNDIEHILKLKSKIFDNYKQLINELKYKNTKYDFCTLKSEINTISSNWMFTIIIKNTKHSYDEYESYMKSNDIEIRPIFYDNHCHKHLCDIKKHNTLNTNIDNYTIGIMLPSYPELTYSQQQHIIDKLITYV